MRKKPNGLLADLIRVVTCCECGERMQYDDVHAEWLCANLHQPEPDEEVYQEVCHAVERANMLRTGHGLIPLAPSLVFEGIKEPDWTAEDMPAVCGLFRAAIQVDELCGGVKSADAAMRKYAATRTYEEFRDDYREFVMVEMGQGGAKRPGAGWWPWAALERAWRLASLMDATRAISDVWITLSMPRILGHSTPEQVDRLAEGLLLAEAEACGVLF